MEDTLKQILGELKVLREGQKRLESGQQELEVSQKRLESGQQELEAGQKRLEEKVNDLGSELRSNFKYLDGRLADEIKSTKVNLEYLSSKAGKHDMQINNLEKKIQS
jgi:peptidoglycan hydrolase CwlO-like protein